MANKIKPKRSYTANAVPTTSDLDTNELAINWADSKAFTKNAAGNIVSVSLGGGGTVAVSGSVTIPQLGDEFFSSVSLLLHMNGSGSTFVDSSGSPKTITAGGNATQSTTQSKWGGKSAYFDGSGDYIETSTYSQSSLQFSTQPHTVEFWFRTGSTQQYTCLFYRGRPQSSAYDYVLNINNSSASSGDLALYSIGFGGVMTTSSGGWNDNAWHHVAVVRDAGNVFRIYVDGVQRATRTYNMTESYSSNSDSIIRIGKDGALSGRDYEGYIDDVRISTVCRYPDGSAFTPPLSAFADAVAPSLSVNITGSSGGSGLTWSSVPASATATGTAGSIAYDGSYFYLASAQNTWVRAAISSWDPYFSSTALLLHADGSGNSFVDSSASPVALTAAGNATQSSAQSKFNGKSAYITSNSSDAINIASSNSLIASGDFCLDGWAYFNDVSGTRMLINTQWIGDGVAGEMGLWIHSTVASKLTLWVARYATGTPLLTSSTTLTTGTWYYFAIVRSGNTWSMYLNGTREAQATSSATVSKPLICIGNYVSNTGAVGGFPLNGYLDELRFTNSSRGISGTTIPVPTAAFANA